MITDIQSLKEYIENNKIDEDRIISIMSVIRNEIESRNIQKEFPLLNMFCNWCLHPKLSKTMLSIDIMQDYICALCSQNGLFISSPKKFSSELIDRLFEDIRSLFMIVGVDSSFISSKKEIADIFFLILRIIIERPLIIDVNYIFQNKGRAGRYNEFKIFCKQILQKEGIDILPKSLSVFRSVSEGNKLFWRIELLNSPTDICFEINYDKYAFLIL